MSMRIFVLLNVVVFAAIILLTQLLFTGSIRVKVLGWICVGFSVSVFAAPLSVIVRTETVAMVSVKSCYRSNSCSSLNQMFRGWLSARRA